MGTFWWRPLEDDLRRIASEVEREDLVIELKGAVANDEVLNFYRNHEISVFINVSTSEGVPVSIMEAISFDIPVVATSVGGTPEIVGGSCIVAS
ncbi:glycosyltransferase [Arthrobacter alpinus]|nr:glycosyltransferase [Arthrobacter alpinus]